MFSLVTVTDCPLYAAMNRWWLNFSRQCSLQLVLSKWVPALAGKAKAGMFHVVSRWMQGVQVKLWNPLRTHAIPECLRGVFVTIYKSTFTFTLHLGWFTTAYHVYHHCLFYRNSHLEWSVTVLQICTITAVVCTCLEYTSSSTNFHHLIPILFCFIIGFLNTLVISIIYFF